MPWPNEVRTYTVSANTLDDNCGCVGCCSQISFTNERGLENEQKERRSLSRKIDEKMSLIFGFFLSHVYASACCCMGTTIVTNEKERGRE